MVETAFLINLINSLPEGVYLILKTWGFMFILRLSDALFFKNSLPFFLGFYSKNGERRNYISWLSCTFTHGNWKHFGANTLPFLVLGSLLAWNNTMELLVVSAIIIFVTCFGVYFFEKGKGPTIGASGLITGFFGYLFLNGFLLRDINALIISGITLVFYQGIFYVVFSKLKGNVSNIAHYWGFAGGLFASLFLNLEYLQV